MINQKPKEYCVVCGNKIFRGKNSQITKLRRSILAVTCNHKCSKIYFKRCNKENSRRWRERKKLEAKNNEKTKNRSSHQ